MGPFMLGLSGTFVRVWRTTRRRQPIHPVVEEFSMSLASEFKAFAMRGNVVDLAIGVVIGAAFGKIVTALVDKIIMPPIGYLTGGVDFSKLGLTIQQAVGDKPAVVIGYGEFLNTLVQFTIIAFALFLIIKAMNRVIKKEEAAPAPPAADVVLLTEIRDLLKKQG
jgi:large conductance mechanosensitive channel